MTRDVRQWVLALTGLAAEPDVVRQLAGCQQDVRRVTDVVELLAVAQSAISDRVLVSARFPHMNREVAFRLAAQGVSVWGLIDPGDDSGERLVRDWGITTVVMTAGLDLRELPLVGRTPPPRPDPHGVVVAVTGPAGAPGRSTVALNLAAEWGSAALVVDADGVAPALGFMLGLPATAPGVRGACREAAVGRLDSRLLRAAAHLEHGVTLLPGTRGAQPTGGADALLDLCARTWPVTVVDCGGPDLGELGSAAVARAACLVEVALPNALGIRRWVEHLPEVTSGSELLVVWNQVQRGRDAASMSDLIGVVADAAPKARTAGLPWDPRVPGIVGPLRNLDPRGRLRRGIVALAAALGGDLHRRRSAVPTPARRTSQRQPAR